MALTFPVLVNMYISLSAPSCLSIMLPRYLNDSTFATGSSSSNIRVLQVVLFPSNLIFFLLILGQFLQSLMLAMSFYPASVSGCEITKLDPQQNQGRPIVSRDPIEYHSFYL